MRVNGNNDKMLTFPCGLTNRILQVASAVSLKTLMARWMMYRDECFRNISREPPMTGEAWLESQLTCKFLDHINSDDESAQCC